MGIKLHSGGRPPPPAHWSRDDCNQHPLATVLACQEASTPTLQPVSSKVYPLPSCTGYQSQIPSLHRPFKSADTSILLSPLRPHCCPFSCCSRERELSALPPVHCQVPARPLWPWVHLRAEWQSLGSAPLPSLHMRPWRSQFTSTDFSVSAAKWRWHSLGQCFSNFTQEILLKCRFWFCRSGVGPRILHFWQASRWCFSCCSAVLRIQRCSVRFLQWQKNPVSELSSVVASSYSG